MDETTQPQRGLASRAARAVPARPADVFRALTDPQSVMKWWGKTEKSTLVACDMDVRHGGGFRLGIRRANGDEDVVSGTYEEVAPPHHLVFSWSSEKASDAVVKTQVRMDLYDLKDGTTRVVINHYGLPAPHVMSVYSAGWHDVLQDLTLYFANP
jgi:uncharacterized protein YndB with AHSA1/START domain